MALATLLESGSLLELRAAVERVGVRPIEEWLRQRAGRQLTRRSRAFWGLVVGLDDASPGARPHELGDALWPL